MSAPQRKPVQTHLKPRWGTEWPNPDQGDGIEYIFRLRNNNSKGMPPEAFRLAAVFEPPIAFATICERHEPGQQIGDSRGMGDVTVESQKTRYFSIYAKVTQGTKPGTAQLKVLVRRPSTDLPDVIEDGHNAVLTITGGQP